MDIIVYYPVNNADQLKLKQNISIVHAEFIKKHIQKLSYSKEQKIELIQAMLKAEQLLHDSAVSAK